MTYKELTNLDRDLPYRFKHSAFKRYEQIIFTVISAYPTIIPINPRLTYSLAPVTFASRFRDAMTSYAKYNWPSDIIDRVKFELCYTEGIFTREAVEPGLVHIGGKAVKENKGFIPPYVKPLVDEIVLNSDDAFNVMCQLAHNRLLTSEVTCSFIPQITELILQTMKLEYEQKYDVSIEINRELGTVSII